MKTVITAGKIGPVQPSGYRISQSRVVTQTRVIELAGAVNYRPNGSQK